MTDGVRIRVTGIEQANRNLRRLETKVRTKVIRKAVRVGTNVALKAARSEAPSDTGTLRKATYVKVSLDRRRGALVGEVALRKKKYANRRNPRMYQHLVILGTKPHVIPGPIVIGGNVVSNIEHPGTKPNDYLDRAFRRSDRAALRAFRDEYGRGVEAETRALPK